jgi:trypsin
MGQILRRMWSLTGAVAAAILSSAAMTTPATGAGMSPAQPTPIIGGHAAHIADYPWVVYLTDQRGFEFCGGTIAKANKIVTAAHCVKDVPAQSIQVVAGREKKQSTTGTVAKVTGAWMHPKFQAAEQGSDIAVLTLDRPLPQSAEPLASKQDSALYKPGTPASVLGWGATSEGGTGSNTLQEADLPVSSDQDCSKAFGSQYSPDSMVCSGIPEGGLDACQGDSGGPLVSNGKLIGLVSWGSGCGRPNTPGVYTRVATYYDDVQAQLAG